MFNHTKEALAKIKRDLNTISIVIETITIFLMIGYLIFALIANVGNFIINVTLLSVVSLYSFIYFLHLIFNFSWFKNFIKKYYTRIRILILSVSLGITIYDLYVTTTAVNPLTIIITTLMIVFWCLKVVIEIVKTVFLAELNYLVNAINQDKKEILEPVKKAADVVVSVADTKTKAAFGLIHFIAKHKKKKKENIE